LGVDFTAFGEHGIADPTVFDAEAFVSSPAVSSAIDWTCSWHPNAHNWTKVCKWGRSPEHDTPAETFASEGTIDIDLPGGFAITFGRHLFGLYHVTRWHRFLADQKHRMILRTITRHLSHAVGSELAVYLPDSMFKSSAYGGDVLWGGGDLEQLMAALHEACGPPAFDPAVMYRDDIREEALETGYFVDRFVGLD
jgi:hypothetical protein